MPEMLPKFRYANICIHTRFYKHTQTGSHRYTLVWIDVYVHPHNPPRAPNTHIDIFTFTHTHAVTHLSHHSKSKYPYTDTRTEHTAHTNANTCRDTQHTYKIQKYPQYPSTNTPVPHPQTHRPYAITNTQTHAYTAYRTAWEARQQLVDGAELLCPCAHIQGEAWKPRHPLQGSSKVPPPVGGQGHLAPQKCLGQFTASARQPGLGATLTHPGQERVSTCSSVCFTGGCGELWQEQHQDEKRQCTCYISLPASLPCSLLPFLPVSLPSSAI